jgi:uncharacterized phage protein gp47/JayE
MAKFTPKSFEQILAGMITRVIARTNLSDVGDSSVLKHLLAAAAKQDSEQYYQMTLLLQLFSIDTASGEDLDERAKEIQPGLITRLASTKAVGTVIFSRAGTTGTTAIPIGTRLKTSDGKQFTTTAAGSISPTSPEQISGHGTGRDSGFVPVIAMAAGSVGNVVSGTVIKFDVKPGGVDSVINLSTFTQGADVETDDSFRARLKAYIASLPRSTVGAIESGIVGQQDPNTGVTALFAKVIEDPYSRGLITIYVDDGTGTAETTAVVASENVTLGLAGPPPDSAVGGEETLFLDNYAIKDTNPFTLTSSIRGALTINIHYVLNPATGQLDFTPALVATEVITAAYTYYTGLIAFIQKIVDGDPNDRTTYPGLRAAGILAIVKTPQVLLQNVIAALTIKEGYDQTTVKANVVQAIKDYINALQISGDVIRAHLVQAIMGIDGVYDVILTTPATNITLLDDQIARTTDSNISVT